MRMLALLLLLCSVTAFANPVDVYQFESAELKTRFYGLIDELRCPKCQNTNLAGSDAAIAKDLRATVYRLVVTEGRSDAEVRAYLRDRYGDFVLYDPPLRIGTLGLWLLPGLLLVVGVIVAWRFTRQPPAAAAVLSEEERTRVADILAAQPSERSAEGGNTS